MSYHISYRKEPPRGRSNGRKIWPSTFLDRLFPNQPKTAIKSILATKSYGMTCHTTLINRVSVRVDRTPSILTSSQSEWCCREENIRSHEVQLQNTHTPFFHQISLLSLLTEQEEIFNTMMSHSHNKERTYAENYDKRHDKLIFLTAISILIISSWPTTVQFITLRTSTFLQQSRSSILKPNVDRTRIGSRTLPAKRQTQPSPCCLTTGSARNRLWHWHLRTLAVDILQQHDHSPHWDLV